MKYLVWPLLLLLIFFRYSVTRPVYKNGDRVRITASVLTDPVRYPTSQYLKIAGLKTYLPLFPEISYGDKIVVEGNVDNGKLTDAKLVSVGDAKTFLSGVRNSILSFYQKVLP